jgi:hypothetical protein
VFFFDPGHFARNAITGDLLVGHGRCLCLSIMSIALISKDCRHEKTR